MILTALLALFYRQAIGSQNELKIMTVGNTPPPAEAQGAHDGQNLKCFSSIRMSIVVAQLCCNTKYIQIQYNNVQYRTSTKRICRFFPMWSCSIVKTKLPWVFAHWTSHYHGHWRKSLGIWFFFQDISRPLVINLRARSPSSFISRLCPFNRSPKITWRRSWRSWASTICKLWNWLSGCFKVRQGPATWPWLRIIRSRIHESCTIKLVMNNLVQNPEVANSFLVESMFVWKGDAQLPPAQVVEAAEVESTISRKHSGSRITSKALAPKAKAKAKAENVAETEKSESPEKHHEALEDNEEVLQRGQIWVGSDQGKETNQRWRKSPAEANYIEWIYKSMHSIRVYRNLIPICQLRDFGACRGTLEPGSMEATDEQNAIHNVEALKSAMVWCTFSLWAVRLWDHIWDRFQDTLVPSTEPQTRGWNRSRAGPAIVDARKSFSVGHFIDLFTRKKWYDINSCRNTTVGKQRCLLALFLESAGTLGFIAWSFQPLLWPKKDTFWVRFVPDNFTS